MSEMIPRVKPRPDRLKRCSKCRKWLPIKCFHARLRSPDGHSTECRACHNERVAANRNRSLDLLRRIVQAWLEGLSIEDLIPEIEAHLNAKSLNRDAARKARSVDRIGKMMGPYRVLGDVRVDGARKRTIGECPACGHRVTILSHNVTKWARYISCGRCGKRVDGVDLSESLPQS